MANTKKIIKPKDFTLCVTMDQFIVDFIADYGDLIDNWSSFARESIRHYIPFWIQKLQRHDQFKHKYINEAE